MTGISVVVPIYNASAWIREALQSVVEQRCPLDLLEVLAVDDGSTDRSAEIAGSYLASAPIRGRLIRTANGGPSRARNIGWRQARGEWIQFLDADDLLHPEKVAVQAEAAAAQPGGVAIVYSSWQVLLCMGHDWLLQEPVRSPTLDVDPISDLLRSEGFVHAGSALFRKAWLEQVGGFDERYSLIEDVDLMLRIAMAGGEFRRVGGDQPLFFYRRHAGGSLSQQDRRGFVEGCIRNADLVERYCRDHGALTAARAQAVASVYFQAARHYAEWDRSRFLEMVQKLEALCPGFKPGGPPWLRWLSRLVGYPKAEMVAVTSRRVRRALGREGSRHRQVDLEANP
jgi:glycosyltransferase involved in cell wall biosynthesis